MANAVFQRALRRQNRAAGVQHEGVNRLRRIRDLHLQLLARGQAAFHQLVHVMRRMHQQHICLACRLRLKEIALFGDMLLQQPLADEPELVGTEDVLADGQEIFVAVDQFEGQHGPAIWAKRVNRLF